MLPTESILMEGREGGDKAKDLTWKTTKVLLQRNIKEVINVYEIEIQRLEGEDLKKLSKRVVKI